MSDVNRVKIIQRASWAGIVGNGIVSVLKLVFGFLSGSLAVVADGIDSATDILTSIITLISAKISSRPPDFDHPYGHSRAETIATKLVSFIIAFAGTQLLIGTISSILSGEVNEIPSYSALIVTGVSIVGKILLALYKDAAGKKAKSQMLIADAKNMRNDILISVSVLVGLGFIYWLNLPIIDRILALLLSMFIIKTGVEIFFETSQELMDGMEDCDKYTQVFDAVKKVKGAGNPHRVRIRKMNNELVIDLDIEVDPQLTVAQGHDIAIGVEHEIKNSVDSVYDVLVHIEPEGVQEPDERFGLRESDMKSFRQQQGDSGCKDED